MFSSHLPASPHVPDLASVLESFPANIAYVDAGLVYRFVNSNYESLFGRPREDIVGRPVADVLGAPGFAVAGPRLRRALAGEAQAYESEFRFAGRPPCWMAVHYIPDPLPDGGVRGMFVFAVDTTVRNRAEVELLASRARHGLLYEQAPIGICYYDTDCRLVEMNRRAASLLGVEAGQARGRTLIELMGAEVAAGFVARQREVLADGVTREFVDEVDLAGDRRWFQSSYAPVPGPEGRILGLQIVSSDITDLRRAEQANREAEASLRQTQKLQAIGLLAGGVAHDFNNILQTVLSFTSEMLDDQDLDRQHREDIGVVRDACRKGASLTAQLLAFSRQQRLLPQPLDAHEAVTSVFSMIRRLVGEDIQVRLEFRAERAHIRADEGQLAQVMLNLAVNARDAMPGGGSLLVTTANRTVAAGSDLEPGDFLVIGVRDSGRGIEPEVIDRIFEPFFTTKEPGLGTGLGLATVFGIVRQHGGRVDVTSRPGEGALFEVLLPLHDERATVAGAAAADTPRGGRETILVAEDDPDVRNLLCRRLRRAGYEVHAAADGDEAVALHAQLGGRVDLVVLDVVMPGRGGRQVLQELRELRAGLPVLFLSGYPLDEGDSRPEWDPSLPLLRKPVTGDDLCREVRRCLDCAVA